MASNNAIELHFREKKVDKCDKITDQLDDIKYFIIGWRSQNM